MSDAQRVFQLDQNMDAPHLVEACEQEGIVQAYRYPERLRGEPDRVMLAELLPKGNTIVTADAALPQAHADSIPDSHPGIVIVKDDDEEVKTMTTHRAQSILADFKEDVANWHSLPLDDFVLYIKPAAVEIYQVRDGTLSQKKYCPREANWQSELLGALNVMPPPHQLP